jgi:hypothetical protein
MSNAGENDLRERREAATALVADYEEGNLHKHQADAMVLKQFLDLELHQETGKCRLDSN